MSKGLKASRRAPRKARVKYNGPLDPYANGDRTNVVPPRKRKK